MTQYRYQLERYRGRSTRHVCPQCGRKNVFTRYIDTYNNNIYINDIVGKCNRLDKCGYHYTPHQYFTDNPWKRDTPRREECSFVLLHRKNERTNSTPPLPPEPKRVSAGLPRRVLDATMQINRLLKRGVLKSDGKVVSVAEITKSQNHTITGGGGSVIGCDKCDKCEISN